jgi:hypothetical protein
MTENIPGRSQSSALNKDFDRIQWNRLEPMGFGALQPNNRSWFLPFVRVRPPRLPIPRFWRA